MPRQFALKSHINRYFLTYVSAAVSFYVFFSVDQIQRVWYQTPPWNAGHLVQFGYTAFMSFTLSYCFLALVEVIFQTSRFPVLSRIERIPVVKRFWLAGRFASFDWILWIVRRWPGVRLPIGGIATLVGLILLLADLPGDASLRWYPLMGTVCHSAGLITFLIGFWLLARSFRLSRKVIFGTRPFAGLFTVQLIRVLTWFIETLIVTEALWLLASNSEFTRDYASYRLSTIWACFVYFTIVIIIASVIDRWAVRAEWPVRVLAIALIVFFFYRDRAASVEHNDYKHHQTDSHDITFNKDQQRLLQFLADKINAIKPEDGPVVIVAASGGGSRAAIFTSLVLETLQRTTIDGKFITGTVRPGTRTWDQNIVMISSVSV